MSELAADAPVPPAAAAAAEPAGTTNPFASLPYRFWWIASVVSGAGVGIQSVTVPLFIRDRVSADDRELFISMGLISTNAVGALLTLFGGVLADRTERRRILVRTYAIAALVSVAYVLLSGFDVRAVWPVYPLAVVIGAAGAFTNPARQSMVPQMLSRAQLQNGIILGNIAFMALLQFGGPLLGGVLADFAGLTIAFAIEVVLLFMGALLFYRVITDRPAPTNRSVGHDLVEGLRYVRGEPRLWGLLALGAIPGVFIMGPFAVTVVGFVEDIFERGDAFVGAMWASFGGGVLLGSLVLTRLRLPRRGLFVIWCILFGGLVSAAYGLQSNIYTAMATLVLLGAIGPAVFINTVVALLQQHSDPRVMGRVMSMYGLSFSATTPIGYAWSGLAANAITTRAPVIIGGLICSALGLVAWVLMRQIRELE